MEKDTRKPFLLPVVGADRYHLNHRDRVFWTALFLWILDCEIFSHWSYHVKACPQILGTLNKILQWLVYVDLVVKNFQTFVAFACKIYDLYHFLTPDCKTTLEWKKTLIICTSFFRSRNVDGKLLKHEWQFLRIQLHRIVKHFPSILFMFSITDSVYVLVITFKSKKQFFLQSFWQIKNGAGPMNFTTWCSSTACRPASILKLLLNSLKLILLSKLHLILPVILNSINMKKNHNINQRFSNFLGHGAFFFFSES